MYFYQVNDNIDLNSFIFKFSGIVKKNVGKTTEKLKIDDS